MEVAPAGPIQRIPHEWLPRLFVVVGLIALFFAVSAVNLPDMAAWSSRALRVMPRVSVFALGVAASLLIQGPRPAAARRGTPAPNESAPFSNTLLLGGAILAGMGALLLQESAGLLEIQRGSRDNIAEWFELSQRTGAWSESGNNLWFHARPGVFVPGAALLLLRFECALLAAVFLGTWAGRGAREGWHFFALILCAAAGDIWLTWKHVPESAGALHPLAALRMPFAPALPGFCPSPTFTDIFFIAAILEAARVLRLHPLSLALGAVAGYCSAAFLALEPAPGIVFLSMTLTGSGIMAGAWPDLKLDSTAAGKAFFAAALLILMLSAGSALQRKLNPPPKPDAAPERRNVAFSPHEFRRGVGSSRRERGAYISI